MDDIRKKIERVRAIIIASGKILLINRIKNNESYWVIPGGQVEVGENHEWALMRECIEELGVTVRVNKLFVQRASDKPGMEGQQEFFYLCDIIDGDIGSGKGPEFQPGTRYIGEYKIGWINLADLSSINLKPQDIKYRILEEYSKNKQ